MKNHILAYCHIIILVLFISSGIQWGEASSLTVDPGRSLCILDEQNFARPGGHPITLEVYNGGTKPVTYAVVVSAADQDDLSSVTQGYTALPDLSIIRLMNEHVTIPANSRGKVTLFISLPDRPEYRNQHWEALVSVTGAPTRTSMLRMASVVRVLVDTPSSEQNVFRPSGPISMAPSRVTFHSMPGQTGGLTKQVTIFNNTLATAKFHVAVVVPPPHVEGQFIPRSPGFSPLPDREWVTLETRTLEIGPRSDKSIALTLTVPPGYAVPAGGWEALLMVKEQHQAMIFSRLQVLIVPDADEAGQKQMTTPSTSP